MSETNHQLKIWPEYLAAILDGRKKAEVRKMDRDFQEDDLLFLHEWKPVEKQYTGEIRIFKITHITKVPDSNYAVLSLGEP